MDIVPDSIDQGTVFVKAHSISSRNRISNIAISCFVRFDNPKHMAIIEVWQDLKALAFHKGTAETKQLRAANLPITGSPYNERVFVAI